MLKKEIKLIILFFLLLSCNNLQQKDNTDLYFQVSINSSSDTVYKEVQNNINDSVFHWRINKLSEYTQEIGVTDFIVDSLICFNKSANKIIVATLWRTYVNPSPTAAIGKLLGEKIGDKWYFFSSSSSIFIPNEMKKKDTTSYFSYQQLHEIALKEVYSGYLINGQINENWFKAHFEGIAWGDFKNQGPENDWYLKGRRFKTEKEFCEAMHLSNVKNNWLKRDTTKPIIPLPEKSLP
ncbi:MAG: hypothetical protein IPM51_13255 [Sphingobacteriaceae bacterium]|nr:hypothetical protein [Sphingobacteriaceae bacterium]